MRPLEIDPGLALPGLPKRSVFDLTHLMSPPASLLALSKDSLDQSHPLLADVTSGLAEVISTKNAGKFLSLLNVTQLGTTGCLRDASPPGKIFEFPRRGSERRFVVVVSNHLANAQLMFRFRNRQQAPGLAVCCRAYLHPIRFSDPETSVTSHPLRGLGSLSIAARFPELLDIAYRGLTAVDELLNPSEIEDLQGKTRRFLGVQP